MCLSGAGEPEPASEPDRIIEFQKLELPRQKQKHGNNWKDVRLIIYQCRKFIEIDFRPCETFAFPVSAQPLLLMFAWLVHVQ